MYWRKLALVICLSMLQLLRPTLAWIVAPPQTSTTVARASAGGVAARVLATTSCIRGGSGSETRLPSRSSALRMSSGGVAERLVETSGDGKEGDGITLTPSSGTYNNVVVWMHGLGDTAAGWYSAMPALQLSSTKYILPTAPSRPITLNGGFKMPGWMDILGLDRSADEDEAGLTETAKRINAIIDAEIAKGIPAEKIAVCGFSQGGGVALHVSLRRSTRLGACVVCSGWVPLQKQYPEAFTAGGRQTPVLMCHGEVDEVVQYQWGKQSAALLLSNGLNVELVSYPRMGHSACQEELEKISGYLKDKLGA